MLEKMRPTGDVLIEQIIDARNCDDLRDRQELREKLRKKSRGELEEILQRETSE